MAAFVSQGVGSGKSLTLLSVTITAPTNGDSLVAAICGSTSSLAINSVTETGATWTRGSGQAGFVPRTDIWYAFNVQGAGTSVTIAASASTSLAVNISEFSGMATVTANDVGSQGAAGSSSTPSSGSITTTNANDVIVACVGFTGTATVSANPTGWTPLTFVNTTGGSASTNAELATAYQIVSAIGTYSASWTLSATSTSQGAIYSLKAAGGAPAARQQTLTLMGVGA